MDPPHLMRGAWRPAPAGLPQDGSRGRAAPAPAEPGPANADKGEAPPAPPPAGFTPPSCRARIAYFHATCITDSGGPERPAITQSGPGRPAQGALR